MSIKLGFIGNGNMGYAILRGLIDQNILAPEETAVYDLVEKIRERAEELGSRIFADEVDLVRNSEIVLIAVKPQNAEVLFHKIGEAAKGKLLVSIIAGYNVADIRDALGQQDVRIMRVMPNTPAMSSAGVFGMDSGTDASDEERQ